MGTTPENIARVVSCEDFHSSLLSVAASIANSTTRSDIILEHLRGFLYEALVEGKPAPDREERLRLMLSADSPELQDIVNWTINETLAERAENITELPKPKLIAEEFPMGLLPKRLRVAVEEVSRSVKVPPEAVAIVYMSFMMIAMGTGISVHEKVRLVHHTSLGFILSMAPGERKSGVFNLLSTCLDKCRAYAKDKWIIEKSKAESTNGFLDKKIKQLKTRPPAEVGTKEFDNWIVKIACTEGAKVDVPVEPIIYVDDATEEVITNHIIGNGGALGVMSPDARAIVGNIKGQHKKGDHTGESIFIKGIANDPIAKDRVSTGSGSVSKSCLNLIGMVQPDAAYNLMSDKAVTKSGLLGRIFFISPVSLVGQRIEGKDEAPLQVDKLEAMEAAIFTIFKCINFDLKLSDEATEQRRLYHNEIELKMASDGEYYSDAEIVNKLCTSSVKIASAFFAIDQPEKFINDGTNFIDGKTYERARDFTNYLMRQNLYMLKHQRGDKTLEVAKFILRTTDKEYSDGYFTKGKFISKHMSGSKADYFDDAIDMLKDSAMIDIKFVQSMPRFSINSRGCAAVEGMSL